MSVSGPGISRRSCLAGMLVPMMGATPASAQQMRSIGHDVPAPSVAFPILGGGTGSFDAFPDIPVLVAFWASWCVPCRAELPALAKFREQHGVGVLAINAGESEARIVPFLSQHGLHALPVLLDHDRKAMVEWRVTVLPTAYVVAPDRRIRYLVVGEIDWSDASVQERILSLRGT